MAPEADRTPFILVAGVVVYRALLHLYPHSFLQTYSDELEADFEERSHDALAFGGRRALLLAWCETMADLVISLSREWLRTPWIPVLCAAAVISGAIFVAVWGRGKRAFGFVTTDRADDSLQLLFLIVFMALIPVVGIVIVWWTLQLTNLRSSRWRRRV